jgi:hypothetical protein
MKAIETSYKGYKFRSRLEARWAVFFDSLGLEWEYETEGFNLENGLYYLPDFYLPNFIGRKAWIEVKPDIPYPDDVDTAKVVAYQKAIFPNALIFVAAKDPFAMDSCLATLKEQEDGGIGVSLCFLGSLPDNQLVLIATEENGNAVLIHPSGHEDISGTNYFELIKSPLLDKARVAARSARFEHGQHGAK